MSHLNWHCNPDSMERQMRNAVGPWPTLRAGTAAPEHAVRDGALATSAAARVCHVQHVRQVHVRTARRLRAAPRRVY
eukprot:2635850-Alexandrium_andersonii.AAC.1